MSRVRCNDLMSHSGYRKPKNVFDVNLSNNFQYQGPLILIIFIRKIEGKIYKVLIIKDFFIRSDGHFVFDLFGC